MGLNVVIAKRVYFALRLFYSINMVSYKYTDSQKAQGSITGFIEGQAALG